MPASPSSSSRRVSVRLTAEQHGRIEYAATAAGLPIDAWIAKAALAAVGPAPLPAGTCRNCKENPCTCVYSRSGELFPV